MEIGPHSVKMEQEDSEEEVEIYPYSSDFVIIPSDENNGLQPEVGKCAYRSFNCCSRIQKIKIFFHQGREMAT